MGEYPSESTKQKIYAKGQGKCYFENCRVRLVNDNGTNVGKIAHIFPRKKSQVRGDHPDFPDDLNVRNKPWNLIALCGPHHDIIDDPDNADIYTVEYLLALKSKVESKYYNKSDQISVYSLKGNEKFKVRKETVADRSTTHINGRRPMIKLGFFSINVFFEPVEPLNLSKLEEAARTIFAYTTFNNVQKLNEKQTHDIHSISYWSDDPNDENKKIKDFYLQINTLGEIEYVNQSLFHEIGVTNSLSGQSVNVGTVIFLNDLYYTLVHQLCELYILARLLSKPQTIEFQIRCSGLNGTRLIPIELPDTELTHRIQKRGYYKKQSGDSNDYSFENLILPNDIELDRDKIIRFIDEYFSSNFEEFWMLADIYNSVTYEEWRQKRRSQGWLTTRQ